MNIFEITRAWKDSSFRNSLSEEQRAELPASPVGEMLTEEELRAVSGECANGTVQTAFGDSSYCNVGDNYYGGGDDDYGYGYGDDDDDYGYGYHHRFWRHHRHHRWGRCFW